MSFMRRIAAIAVLTLALLAGCGGDPPAPPGNSTQPTAVQTQPGVATAAPGTAPGAAPYPNPIPRGPYPTP